MRLHRRAVVARCTWFRLVVSAAHRGRHGGLQPETTRFNDPFRKPRSVCLVAPAGAGSDVTGSVRPTTGSGGQWICDAAAAAERRRGWRIARRSRRLCAATGVRRGSSPKLRASRPCPSPRREPAPDMPPPPAGRAVADPAISRLRRLRPRSAPRPPSAGAGGQDVHVVAHGRNVDQLSRGSTASRSSAIAPANKHPGPAPGSRSATSSSFRAFASQQHRRRRAAGAADGRRPPHRRQLRSPRRRRPEGRRQRRRSAARACIRR